MAMNKVIGIIAIFFAALGRAAAAGAQAKPLSGGDVERIYTRLREQIARIPIYDNHSHATFPDDADMDAMAAPPGESSVLRLRDDNPEFVAAAKALFAYPYNDFQPEHAKWLIDKKKAAEASGNTAYWDGILDKMNIATCLANRVAFAPYLDPQRFHWVFFADSFLFPFDNRNAIGEARCDVHLVQNAVPVRGIAGSFGRFLFVDKPFGVFGLEIVVGVGEQRLGGGHEFGIVVAQAKYGAFAGRRGHRDHVGIVGEGGVRMVVVDRDAGDLLAQACVDSLDVAAGKIGR